MAGEIRVNSVLQVVNGSINTKLGKDVRIDQTTPGFIARTQTISTSGTDLTLSGVTTPRAIELINLDATNYIDWGPKSGGSMIPLGQLKAGESSVVTLYPGVTIRAQANTSNCSLQMGIAET